MTVLEAVELYGSEDGEVGDGKEARDDETILASARSLPQLNIRSCFRRDDSSSLNTQDQLALLPDTVSSSSPPRFLIFSL